MTPHDTMRRMPAPPKPPPPDTPVLRLLTGKAVKDLIAYKGMNVSQAGNVQDNLSTPTLRRIIRGVEPVGDGPLLSVAKLLDLPVNIFLLMLEGDATAIAELETTNEHGKNYILSLLESSRPESRRRRGDADKGLANGS